MECSVSENTDLIPFQRVCGRDLSAIEHPSGNTELGDKSFLSDWVVCRLNVLIILKAF